MLSFDWMLMSNKKYVAYYRVSTQKQGLSGLGLDAQKQAVESYFRDSSPLLIDEFVEIETGKGANALDKRPQLKAALELCRKNEAILIIAKLDRLARNVHFISGLMESRVKFVACDLPEANELTLHVMAAFAEYEAKRISLRTKEALAIAKSRGVVLGRAGPDNLKKNVQKRMEESISFASNLSEVINGFKSIGLSQRAMVAQLNQLDISTCRGGKWTLIQLQRVLKKIG